MLAVRASRCFGVRHCARTAAPAVLLATSETIAGYEVVEHKGIATGSTVRTKDIAQDMFSAFRGMFGGELTRYTTLLQDSREEALSRLQEDAASRGHGERPADRLSEAACAKRQPNWGGWVIGGTGARPESRLYRGCIAAVIRLYLAATA